MKSRPNPFLRSAALATSIVLSFGHAASADDLYWDANGTTSTATGGAGTWSTANTWRTGSSTGGLGNWTNGNNAFFGGTAGAVTTGSVSLGTLNVATAGYTFNSGTLTFSSGTIDVTTATNTIFNANLAGSLVFRATGNTSTTSQAGGIGTIAGNNTLLTSFELNTGAATNQLLISNAGALGLGGPTPATVKLTQGVAGLSATNGTTYNAWTTEFAGGVLRLRVAGASTYSGNGTLTANTDFATIAGANLIYSGTLALGNNTLTLAPQSATGAVTLNNTISGNGNITVNNSTNANADGLGTVTLGAANTFNGTATTTQSKGTLALNHLNALQNATLDTGASGTQFVTFLVAGANTYNIGALAGSDALAIGANTVSLGNKAGSSSFGADITGGGGLIKTGSSSTQILTAATSYSGATQITGGTLALTGSGAINSTTGISISGSATGAKLNASGSAAVTKTVTLTEGTLTGSGTVNTVNVGAGTGGIISNNNGVAGAALTIGALTFEGAATVNLWSSSTSAPLVTTTLATNAAGNVTINANAGSWTNGSTYDLISYGGGTVGGAGIGKFVLGAVTGKATRQSATLGSTSTAITLEITGDNPVWSGANGGIWNTSATDSATSGAPNWALKNAHTTTDFWVGDIAEFNDTLNIDGTPVAPTTTTVTIQGGDVSPVSATFNNSSLDYTLTSSDGSKIAAGVLTKNGSGKLTISTANTYAGATSINGGNLTISGSGTLGSGSALTLGGGQLDLGTTSQAVGAVSITASAASGDTILNGSLTGTSYAASNTSGNAVISANLLGNGAAGFTKSGAGTATLSGTNTWTGTTAINAGSLVLSGAGTLGNGAALTLGGGSLDLGTLSRTVGAVSVTSPAASGDTISNGSLTGTSYSASNTSGDAVISANLLVNGAAGFAMSGASGTVTLAGTNTYTGATSVTGGTLKAGSTQAFGVGSAVTLANIAGVTLNLNGYSNTIGSLSGGGATGGTVALGSSNLTISNGASLTYGGNLSGSGSLLLTTGQLTLAKASPDYTGNVTLSSGAILITASGVSGALGPNTAGTQSVTVESGATFSIGAGNNAWSQLQNIVINGTGAGGQQAALVSTGMGFGSNQVRGIAVATNANIFVNSNGASDQKGLNAQGPLAGSGTLTITGGTNSGFLSLAAATGSVAGYSSFTGNVNVRSTSTNSANAGGLISNHATALGTTANIDLGSNTYFQLGASQTIGGLSSDASPTIAPRVTLGAHTLTIGSTNNLDSSFSGVISSTGGGITKAGSGTLTLKGANTYTGATTVQNGTLQLTGSLSTSTTLNLGDASDNSGKFILGSSDGLVNQSVAGLSITGAGTTNAIVGGNSSVSRLTVTNTTGTSVFSGKLGGSLTNENNLALTKSGAGALTLSGDNTFTGGVILRGDTAARLNINSATALGTGTFTINSGDSAKIDNNSGAPVTLTTNNEQTWTNNFEFVGTNSLNMGTGAVTLGGNRTVTTTTAARALTIGGVIDDGESSYTLVKAGAGIMILAGSNSYDGTTTVSGGSLNIQNIDALGSTTGATSVSNGATLQLQGGYSYASETLTLTTGSSSNVLLQNVSGNNTWNGTINATGSSTASHVTRVSSDADLMTLAGSVNLGTVTANAASQLVLQGNGNIEVTGKISGTGAVTAGSTGTGTRTLSNATNDYTGTTSVNGGTLRAGVDNAIPYGTGKGNLSFNGGVFDLNGFNVNINGLTSATASVGTIANNATGTNKTLTIGNNNATTSFTGVIADNTSGTGTVAIIKTGTGAQTLGGINTYTGGTAISNGTLTINGDSSAATGAVSVAAGATLKGTGIVGGATTIAAETSLGAKNGGIHSPGASVGKQTFDASGAATTNLTYATGSIFEWELSATPTETTITKDESDLVTGSNRGTDYDAVNVTGTLSGSDAVFRIVLAGTQTFADTFWDQDRQWTDIFRAADHLNGATETASLDIASIFSGFQYYNSTGDITNTNGTGRSFTITGSTLTWSAVPEPTSALVGLLIVAGLLRRRRGC